MTIYLHGMNGVGFQLGILKYLNKMGKSNEKKQFLNRAQDVL